MWTTVGSADDRWYAGRGARDGEGVGVTLSLEWYGSTAGCRGAAADLGRDGGGEGVGAGDHERVHINTKLKKIYFNWRLGSWKFTLDVLLFLFIQIWDYFSF